MEQRSMTALISAFARWYHSENNVIKIFDDTEARIILSEEEKNSISLSMQNGIGFWSPEFSGTKSEALRWIVDNQLSPTPLARSAFCEKHLKNAASIGARQYMILAAGYDTFGYRQPDWANAMQIYEVDYPSTTHDKLARLSSAQIAIPENVHHVSADFTNDQWCDALIHHSLFSSDRISFCSLLGISYYLTKEKFERLIHALVDIIPKGSSIVFDYPNQDSYTKRAGERAKKQAMLADGAKEPMLACYSFKEVESLLSKHSLFAYEHLIPDDITAQLFQTYNIANPAHQMTAFDNVNYCLAVKP